MLPIKAATTISPPNSFFLRVDIRSPCRLAVLRTLGDPEQEDDFENTECGIADSEGRESRRHEPEQNADEEGAGWYEPSDDQEPCVGAISVRIVRCRNVEQTEDHQQERVVIEPYCR